GGEASGCSISGRVRPRAGSRRGRTGREKTSKFTRTSPARNAIAWPAGEDHQVRLFDQRTGKYRDRFAAILPACAAARGWPVLRIESMSRRGYSACFVTPVLRTESTGGFALARSRARIERPARGRRHAWRSLRRLTPASGDASPKPISLHEPTPQVSRSPGAPRSGELAGQRGPSPRSSRSWIPAQQLPFGRR